MLNDFKPIHNYTINIGQNTGTYTLYYNFDPSGSDLKLPCRLTLTYGNTVLDTGFRGDSRYNSDLNDLGYNSVINNEISGFLTLNKASINPTTATVVLYTPIEESLAYFKLNCPDSGSI